MDKDDLNYLTVKKQGRNIHLSFNCINKINFIITENLKRDLFNFVKKPRTNLILNLYGIKFIDSEGFSALNLISKVSRNFGSTFTLVNINSEVMELFELARKFTHFNIYYVEKENEYRLKMTG